MALTAQIKKRYGDFQLDVDFSAGSGDMLALLGASGCGKSATLRCVAGIDRPDQGHIELDGRVLFDSEKGVNLPPQKRRVGYLFQQYALFPQMTVEQNISVCLRRLDKSRQQQRTAELIAQLRLEGTEKLLPRQLSGGQQQRTALARILAAEPRAILLDEPLAALDSYLKRQLETELRDVLESFGGPVVWVSHDLGEVYRTCGQVCVLDSGKSSPVTGMRELITSPGTVTAARISGCRNFIPIHPGPDARTVSVPEWGLVLPISWREGTTTLGIRAERIHPAEEGFPCRIVRLTEDVSNLLVLLRPEGAAENAPLLQMELDKEDLELVAGRETIRVDIRPEDLLLLQ